MTLFNNREYLLRTLPPILHPTAAISTVNYQNVPIDFSNTLYNEPLVNIQNYGLAGCSYYYENNGANKPYCARLGGSLSEIMVRESIANMLSEVNTSLYEFGVELFIWDAFRPLETQKGIWNFFEARVKVKLPEASSEQINMEVSKYVSDPRTFDKNDSTTWPSHITGASVDLTLRDKEDLKFLDMGTYFDEMGHVAHSDYYEQELVHGHIDESNSCLLNRRLLHYAMNSQGFTNYHREYWHFDWGNQLHQLVKAICSFSKPKAAWYGLASYNGSVLPYRSSITGRSLSNAS